MMVKKHGQLLSIKPLLTAATNDWWLSQSYYAERWMYFHNTSAAAHATKPVY
jgi:hypothetical protein